RPNDSPGLTANEIPRTASTSPKRTTRSSTPRRARRRLAPRPPWPARSPCGQLLAAGPERIGGLGRQPHELGAFVRLERGQDVEEEELPLGGDPGAELVPALRELVGERLEITATDSCILQKLHSADCL